jgi:hypothetical protein
MAIQKSRKTKIKTYKTHTYSIFHICHESAGPIPWFQILGAGETCRTLLLDRLRIRATPHPTTDTRLRHTMLKKVMVPITGRLKVKFNHQAMSSLTSAPISNQMSGKKIRWLFSTMLFRTKMYMFKIFIWQKEMKIKLLDILDRFNQQADLQSCANRRWHAHFLRYQTNRLLVGGF